MNGKILILSVFTLAVLISSAHAYDQTNPANVAINYQITTNTSFTLQMPDGQTAMNFSGNRDAKLVEPTGQNIGTSTPWGIILNIGEVAQTFKIKLSAINTGTSVYVSNFSTMSPQTTLSTTASTPSGWSNIATNVAINLFARANFTNAPAGSGTLTIST